MFIKFKDEMLSNLNMENQVKDEKIQELQSKFKPTYETMTKLDEDNSKMRKEMTEKVKSLFQKYFSCINLSKMK